MIKVVEYVDKKYLTDFLKGVIESNKDFSLPSTEYEIVLDVIERMPSIKKEYYTMSEEEQKDWDDFIEKIFEEAKEVVEDEID